MEIFTDSAKNIVCFLDNLWYNYVVGNWDIFTAC